ncbi:flavin reductase family protein [Streptomyces sp. NPDC054766]|uniref:flavin reductase family protein n=1 Tax=Streptomyces rhizosphaerihabitans TaxID=1266770 RepID=UPI0021BEC483|nr:flavin reductase family protein [Streptomyces rhizosphaerihabitans]MCT9008501.1 flavin reductase family protein [Streptomyces rhizosphaerihabitans]
MSTHTVKGSADAGEHDRFRGLMRSFPTGVAVVTAVNRHDRPHGMTCTSLSSVTLDPPSLLVCLNTASGTLAAMRDSGAFTVNLLHARGRDAAEIFSSPVEERFARVGWRPAPRLGQPWLEQDAFAFAECRLSATTVVGDHTVVFGEVVHVEQKTDTPLLYGQQRFSQWPMDQQAAH